MEEGKGKLMTRERANKGIIYRSGALVWKLHRRERSLSSPRIESRFSEYVARSIIIIFSGLSSFLKDLYIIPCP
jgi:hypothetical protein